MVHCSIVLHMPSYLYSIDIQSNGWILIAHCKFLAVSTAASQDLGVNPNDQRPTKSKTPPSWKIKMLYDGECPLCMREVNMLKRRDQGKGAIAFVDIADPNYEAADHEGISFEQSMERIHAILPDGRVITDVEVFRRLYEEVGLGWLYSITKLSLVEKAANAVYSLWAKNRLSLTGRPDIDVILQEKKMCRGKISDE